jgi:hypothetical protein
MFPFSGHIDSFFGDLQVMGFDSMRFDIETKSITTHWFVEKEMIQIKVDIGDGTILISKCPNLSQRSILTAGMNHIPFEKPASIKKNKIYHQKIL